MRERFQDMSDRLSPTMRRIAHRMNGHHTYFGDDDLYQEAIANLWVLYNKGDLDEKTDSYILQGCYFHLKNYLRKHLDRIRAISLDRDPDGGGIPDKDAPAAASWILYNDNEPDAMVRDTALGRLDEREKEIVRLSAEGLTVREIGSRLGISHVMVVKMRKKIRIKCRALAAESR
jgi:RNA polymerase sigma factor (sigma-70 family)